MPLTLSMLRCPPTVAPQTRQVTGGEFSIGRGAGNDWVLADPDKQLSKQHCVFAFRQGTWRVAGTSTNGTFLNRDEEPLESRSPHTLEDGDRLHFGDYEIEIRLAFDTPQTTSTPLPRAEANLSPFASPFADDPFGPTPFPSGSSPVGHLAGGPATESEVGAAPFFTSLPAGFDPLAPDERDAATGPTRSDHSAAVSDALHLPPVSSVIPDDWDLDAPASGLPVARPPPPAAPAGAPMAALAADSQPLPQADTGDLLAAFLRGAGLEIDRPANAVNTMEQLGAAFRALVSGIRQALIARSGMKREFRIEATEIRTHGNNLLKFSANDDDALVGLLGAGRRTDMSPEEAITDALTGIRLHELATMVAMQNAVRALVVRLGPAPLREAAERGGGITLLGNRKTRAWDAYETLHAEVLRGLADDFDSVFGKQFARAYEQAIEELGSRHHTQREKNS